MTTPRRTTLAWTPRPWSAICDDDRCPWKHVAPIGHGDRATLSAREHVRETGHTVTIHRASFGKVTPR